MTEWMAGAGGGLHFDTLAAHAGAPSDTVGGAHPTVQPIVTASSFWYESADTLDRVLGGEEPGYVYARYANPTVRALEEAVAALEQAAGAVAFASGMAAIQAAVGLFAQRPGDTLFVSEDCYGGTYTLVASILAEQGLRVRFVDLFDLPQLEFRLAAEHPKALLFEVLTNPLQRVVDATAVVEAAHRAGAGVVIDATFSPPPIFQGLRLGADVVVHSATKYLGGHGDVTAGVAACGDPARAAELHTAGKLTGAVLGPHEAYLVLRGIRTLGLRVERQSATALSLAHALCADARIERVYYPGLPGDPGHAGAGRLFRGGAAGGVLSFAIRGADRERVLRTLERFRLVRPAPTLGDCLSLVLYPVIASHRGLTPEQRAQRGIHDNILRFSAGLEDPRDLLADLDRALG
ncbi:MAG: PLP-dependent transferase [Chloroflexi bacterium]|nr:PLP-dependent transferase [Chloroflexota bacterium]